MGYDDWRVNGNWHKCECGASWSDSDGGPCHYTCEHCGTEGLDSGEVCDCDKAQIEDLTDSLAKRLDQLNYANRIIRQYKERIVEIEAKLRETEVKNEAV